MRRPFLYPLIHIVVGDFLRQAYIMHSASKDNTFGTSFSFKGIEKVGPAKFPGVIIAPDFPNGGAEDAKVARQKVDHYNYVRLFQRFSDISGNQLYFCEASLKGVLGRTSKFIPPISKGLTFFKTDVPINASKPRIMRSEAVAIPLSARPRILVFGHFVAPFMIFTGTPIDPFLDL